MINNYSVQLKDCLGALRDYDHLLDMAMRVQDTTEPDAEKLLKIDLLLQAYRDRVQELLETYSEE